MIMVIQKDIRKGVFLYYKTFGKEVVNKLATKLRNLKIKKVDFVDDGANPDAHIGMLKRRDAGKQQEEEDFGKSGVGILKRLFNFVGKAAGMDQDEINSAVDEIEKSGSATFNDKISEISNRKIADEIWDTCYALQSCLCSILNDGEVDGSAAETAMQESLDAFYAVVQASISRWTDGKAAIVIKRQERVTPAELEIMKAAAERLNESIEKAVRQSGGSEGDAQDGHEDMKGEEEEMKIDKSKLTPAERAFLEDIEKRCGTDDGASEGSGSTDATEVSSLAEQALPPAELAVVKSVAQTAGTGAAALQGEDTDDIYKGIHPAVKAELEQLKKFREQAEEKELAGIAKKYEIIGKKPEELVPVLKSLRAAGGTAYADMISILDQTVSAVEKSGIFSEIGKSGRGSGTVGAAEAKVEAIAKGYMEKDSSLDYVSAMAKAWEDNPELMDEYEAEAGF